MDLLLTKMQPPALRRHWIDRPALMELLDRGLEQRVVVVQAGIGYGKTTALAAWVDRVAGNVLWYTLDADDNDQGRWWSYLQALFADLVPAVAQVPQLAVRQLINVIAAFPHDIVVVFDEYQTITNPAIDRAMIELIEHAPPQLHVVLATQHSLEFPLTRWRARGWLHSIATPDLVTTVDETAAFLQRVPLELEPAAVVHLHQQCEGWFAALQLASFALRYTPHHHASSLTLDYPLVAELLQNDVLALYPDDVQQFIAQTIHLDHFNSALADATTQRSDSAAMIALLDRQHLFVMQLADGWWRYHYLVAHALRQVLPPATALQRAALWHAERHEWHIAIGYALRAEAWPQALTWIEAQAGAMLTRGEWFSVLKWCEHIPAALLAKHTDAHLFYAWACMLGGRFEHLQQVITELATTIHEHSPAQQRGQYAALRGQYAAAVGNYAAALEYSLAALAVLPADDSVMRGIMAMNAGATYLTMGAIDQAEPLLLIAQQESFKATNYPTAFIAQCSQAMVRYEQADLTTAQNLFDAVISQTTSLPHIKAMAQLGLAYSAVAAYRLEAAVQHAQTAIELAGELNIHDVTLQVYVLLARIAALQNQHQEAQQYVVLAHDYMPAHNLHPLHQLLRYGEIACALLRDDADVVQQWALRMDRNVPSDVSTQRMDELVLLARILIAADEVATAQTLIQHLTQVAQRTTRWRSLIDLCLLQAVIEPERAFSLVQEAFEYAQHGVIAPFVCADPVLHPVIRAQPPSLLRRAIVSLLPAEIQPQTNEEDLTPREYDVLRLLADGASNQAIASALFLTVGTVKGHINKILAKLAVTNRTAAVAEARKRHLLD